MFKNAVIGICGFLVIIETNLAQIILKPPQVSGTVWLFAERTTMDSTGSSGADAGDLFVQYYLYGHYGNPYRIVNSIQCGVIEFDADRTSAGDAFPTDDMTASNWTARLNSLSVIFAYSDQLPFEIRMFDLEDAQEDGSLNASEINSMLGDSFGTLLNGVPEVGTVYRDIDVTAQLKRDLFGDGIGDETSGFILRGIDLGNLDRVGFSGSKPFIAVTVHEQPLPTAIPQTPTPICSALGVSISMPAHFFHPGIACGCAATICNPSPNTLAGIPLFVVLDIHGSYFFAPEFDDFAYYLCDIAPGTRFMEVFPSFNWPDHCGTFEGAIWYAAMTDPGFNGILGEMSSFMFSWGE